MKCNHRLKLYNTETRTKEEVVPIDGEAIRMYTCGPTVYNYAHIGNFRTYIFEDVLRRTIKFFGMKVHQVMNITDVDDKTIKGALDQGITLNEFTQPFTDAFFEDLKTLNIEPAENYPAATDYIEEMTNIIQELLRLGIAYHSTDGSVYYAIDRFPSYGRLSHLCIPELKTGASERVESDEYDKDHAADFVLWKIYDMERDGNIFWDSPFGPGRPGWHIECSAMAMKILGPSIDIHCGGVDNIFPHHENEIAQSEAYSGCRFATHWVHAEHLLVDHKKMSKSLGNFYTLRDLLQKGHTGREVRYMLMQAHYRTQLNFTLQGMVGITATLQRLADFIARLKTIKETSTFGHVQPLIEKTFHAFCAAMADDLNISPALAAIFDLVREVNVLCDQNKIGMEEAKAVLELLHELDCVLGVLPLEPEELPIPQELQEALEKRQSSRSVKNWKEADKWRDFIHSKGYIIEDTPAGARLKKG